MARSDSPTSTPSKSLLKKAQNKFHSFKSTFEPGTSSLCSKNNPHTEHSMASPEGSSIQPAETDEANSKNQPGLFKRVTNLGKPVWSGLTTSLRTFEKSTEVFPPLSSAISELVACLDNIEEAAGFHATFTKLDDEFLETIEVLNRVKAVCDSAEYGSEQLAHLSKYTQKGSFKIDDKGFRGRTSRVSELKKQRRQIETLCRQLQSRVSFIILERSDIQLRTNLLQRLLPVEDARYNSRYSTKLALRQRGHTQESDTKLQEDIYNWARNPSSPKICWVTGAGETIAYDLRERLAKEKQLEASFFCSAESPGCSDCSRIVPTIAFQLARCSTDIQRYLCRVLQRDPDARLLHVRDQWESLIVDMPPVSNSDSMDQSVVVIDALDECVDRNQVALMIESLFDYASALPFKVLVTTRSKFAAIEDRFSFGSHECDLSDHYFLPVISEYWTIEQEQPVSRNSTASLASDRTTIHTSMAESPNATLAMRRLIKQECTNDTSLSREKNKLGRELGGHTMTISDYESRVTDSTIIFHASTACLASILCQFCSPSLCKTVGFFGGCSRKGLESNTRNAAKYESRQEPARILRGNTLNPSRQAQSHCEISGYPALFTVLMMTNNFNVGIAGIRASLVPLKFLGSFTLGPLSLQSNRQLSLIYAHEQWNISASTPTKRVESRSSSIWILYKCRSINQGLETQFWLVTRWDSGSLNVVQLCSVPAGTCTMASWLRDTMIWYHLNLNRIENETYLTTRSRLVDIFVAVRPPSSSCAMIIYRVDATTIISHPQSSHLDASFLAIKSSIYSIYSLCATQSAKAGVNRGTSRPKGRFSSHSNALCFMSFAVISAGLPALGVHIPRLKLNSPLVHLMTPSTSTTCSLPRGDFGAYHASKEEPITPQPQFFPTCHEAIKSAAIYQFVPFLFQITSGPGPGPGQSRECAASHSRQPSVVETLQFTGGVEEIEEPTGEAGTTDFQPKHSHPDTKSEGLIPAFKLAHIKNDLAILLVSSAPCCLDYAHPNTVCIQLVRCASKPAEPHNRDLAGVFRPSHVAHIRYLV